MGIEIVPVTASNVDLAIALGCEIFKPNDHFAIQQELGASVGCLKAQTCVMNTMGIQSSSYVMAYHKGRPAGISGHYAYEGHLEDAWLGWTGVSEKFNGLGIGKAVVTAAFDAARHDGLRHHRIWTSEEPQVVAARMRFARVGFRVERYKSDAHETEGASLARVFTRSADPARKRVKWAESAYSLLDLERFDMARLDRIARGLTSTSVSRGLAMPALRAAIA